MTHGKKTFGRCPECHRHMQIGDVFIEERLCDHCAHVGSLLAKEDAKVAALLKAGCDGGNGEFEALLPPSLQSLADEGATFMPRLQATSAGDENFLEVVWVQVS